jgi:dihydrolipoamide dehydrogenase
MGEAKFKAKDAVNVTDKDGKVTELKAKNFIVATGASAMVPPAWKVDGEKVVTYWEAILQTNCPSP